MRAFAEAAFRVSSAALLAGLGFAETAFAQESDPVETPAPESDVTVGTDAAVVEEAVVVEEAASIEEAGGGTDILSGDTLTLMFDGRLVLANGHETWVDGGLAKARFDGTSDGDFKARVVPGEAFLLWQPRFSSAFSGNVSAGWQLDQDKMIDLMEAYLTFIPPRSGGVGFSAKAGVYWPEISMEHSTGGAWTSVNTITPSAINSWVGEEVKVLGAEATLTAALGQHQLSATAGAFGFNDTSGTLLSFRGWALHDMKATAFGYFELPPRNPFMTAAQEDRTRSLIEIDDRVGFYGRLEWRPPSPIVVNAFYYDNRGDPEAFTDDLQWGWRTRFLNVGVGADLAPNLRLTAQGMTGTTLMGFSPEGQIWIDTLFQSAFVALTHDLGQGAITGRVEAFRTKERGSRMDQDAESEDGWALTAAGRWPLSDHVSGLVEVMHVRSERGTRENLGISPFQAQTVVQASVRVAL